MSASCLKEDKMRCNAEMANFMASVNQTRLQLDVVRLSLSLFLSHVLLGHLAASVASGQHNLG